MKIACVIHSLNGGGAERVMAGLASRLAHRRWHVTLVTLDDGNASRHDLDTQVHRRPLDVMTTPSRHVHLWKRLREIRRVLSGGDFDVVLSFCDATNLLVLLATIGMSLPIVVSERSDPRFQSLGRLRDRLRWKLSKRATAIVCLSDDVRDWLQQRIGRLPIVIPSAVDSPPKNASQHVATNTEVRLLSIGRLEHEKGFDRLLNALKTTTSETSDESQPPIKLTILGDGSQRDALKHQAEQLGLTDQVEFPGWVTPVWNELARADLFVLPSRYEGSPSALLEAMAAGVAVLAVDAGGGVRQTIQHGENGWMVENSDSALQAGLQYLICHPDLRKKISLAAPKVCEQFSWQNMVDEYEKALLAAVNAGNQPSS